MWGSHAAGLRTRDAVALLLALCRAEVERLRVWARPLVAPGAGPAAAGAVLALKEADVRTAWLVGVGLRKGVHMEQARMKPAALAGTVGPWTNLIPAGAACRVLTNFSTGLRCCEAVLRGRRAPCRPS